MVILFSKRPKAFSGDCDWCLEPWWNHCMLYGNAGLHFFLTEHHNAPKAVCLWLFWSHDPMSFPEDVSCMVKNLPTDAHGLCPPPSDLHTQQITLCSAHVLSCRCVRSTQHNGLAGIINYWQCPNIDGIFPLQCRTTLWKPPFQIQSASFQEATKTDLSFLACLGICCWPQSLVANAVKLVLYCTIR